MEKPKDTLKVRREVHHIIVGSLLRVIRLNHGISQEELALRAEIEPAGIIEHVESGHQSIMTSEAREIVNALGYDYADFDYCLTVALTRVEDALDGQLVAAMDRLGYAGLSEYCDPIVKDIVEQRDTEKEGKVN